MAKKKIAQEVTVTEVAEVIETSTPIVVEEVVAVIASAAPKAEKRKGRPVVTNSVRQLKLAEQADRIASGGSIERGRPTNATSARQMRIMAKAALIASGIKVGPGRPKMIKADVVNVELVSEEVEA